jgi:hypothetical protein
MVSNIRSYIRLGTPVSTSCQDISVEIRVIWPPPPPKKTNQDSRNSGSGLTQGSLPPRWIKRYMAATRSWIGQAASRGTHQAAEREHPPAPHHADSPTRGISAGPPGSLASSSCPCTRAAHSTIVARPCLAGLRCRLLIPIPVKQQSQSQSLAPNLVECPVPRKQKHHTSPQRHNHASATQQLNDLHCLNAQYSLPVGTCTLVTLTRH